MSLATALYFGYDAIKRLGDLSNKIQTSMAAVDRIEAILSEPERIQDPPNPILVGALRGDIEFKEVSFAYLRGRDVLKKVNISIRHGKVYALVGASGAGKSTFINLVLRFFDADEGSVTVDGLDVREMLKRDLRRNIAYVPQDPTLINDTVYNNIIWGKPGASREEVISAAQQAYAHDFILQMPNGYDTLIGEGGRTLSGGQQQRIALARVFLRDCSILIFDEATSALDSESQYAIYQAIRNLTDGKTIIMISHRFGMLAIVDEILVFSRGEIVEQGTHRDLIQSDTLYRKLYERQLTKT
jgi:subfamily B ATP-binding cassette protein MsbA